MDNFTLSVSMQGENALVKVGFSLPQPKRHATPVYIQSIEILSGDTTLLSVELASSIPKNASFGFTIKKARSGEKLVAQFLDSENALHTAEALIPSAKKQS